MHVFVENTSGRTELPFENGKHVMGLYNNNLLICLAKDEEARVICRDEEYEFSGAGDHQIPIVWNRNNSCSCTVKTVDGYAKYAFQLDNVRETDDEALLNLYRFVDQMDTNFIIGKEYTIQDLYSSIMEDRVSLIIEKTPYSGYDDQSLLGKIKETIPMVMDICSHPKQSLRTEEAVLDVNLIERVNSRAMDHLASHSEHWKSRSLNGLTPNRLRADIFEDEINIYENLFFRMAVDDVLKYVHHQTVSIEKTIQQNDNAIDWNAYGNALSDYKRMRIFKQLLPNYNVTERKEENVSLENLLQQWARIEKQFSTVEASQFYRSIDRKKHISRNIKPTNILKKDSRYNALYRLWCEIQRQIVLEQNDSKGIIGAEDISLADCYAMYVVVLLLYVFKLMECEAEGSSSFKLMADGTIAVNALFKSDNMDYQVTSEKNMYGTVEIAVKYIERACYEFTIPNEVIPFMGEIRKVLPKSSELDSDGGKLIFHANPSTEEKKAIKNVFHLGNAAKKGMDKDDIRRKNEADATWRQKLEDFFGSGTMRPVHTEEIRIVPQFVFPSPSENAVDKYTENAFNSANGQTIFMLPIDISEYRGSVNDDGLISRLLNYGEKYDEDDAQLWGDYKVGMIPVGQTEINSAQRLMKLISIHASRLQIKWQYDHVRCPICGSVDCSEESKNSWKCNNDECGVIFGQTKHDKEKGGCGSNYEWSRPFVRIKSRDIVSKDYLELIYKKELIFDRLTITDFELLPQDDGLVRYIPICPKCGRRKAVK